MNTLFYRNFAALLFSFFLFSCTAQRNSTPSAIGLVPLQDYRYAMNSLPTDTVYSIYKSEETFNSQFAASSAAVRRPGFDGQWVVAIVLPTETATPLRFERAEVVGKTVNVYAQTCTDAACRNSPAILATIPKVGSALAVRFFINGEQKKAVES
jgi:hypothetical protein